MRITVEEIPIYYDIKGSGIPLVILHGFMLDHEMMVGAFEPLFEARNGWQRIYVDMPGMGRTPAGPAVKNSDDMVRLLSGLIDQLLPGQRFALAGFSYGGYIARGILRRFQAQVDGLALIAPVVKGNDALREVPEPLVVKRDEGAVSLLPDDVAPLILSTLTVQTKPIIARILTQFLPAFPRADQAFIQQLRQKEAYRLKEDPDRLAEPFAKPVLIITGRHDTNVGFVDAFPLAQQYPRATYAALDRAGHGVILEQETLFNVLMSEWLDRAAEERQ